MRYQANSGEDSVDGIASTATLTRRDVLRTAAKGAGLSLGGLGLASIVGCEGKWDPTKGYKGGDWTVYTNAEGNIVDRKVRKVEVKDQFWGSLIKHPEQKYWIQIHVPGESVHYKSSGIEGVGSKGIKVWREITPEAYIDYVALNIKKVTIEVGVTNLEKYEPEGQEATYKVTRRSDFTTRNLWLIRPEKDKGS